MPTEKPSNRLRALLVTTVLMVVTSCGQTREPSIVLLVLDTVRADAVGAQINGQPVTPFLDRLWREGTSFTQAYAPAPWTIPSHASLFTGLLPRQHQAQHDRFRLDESLITLAERLGESGYDTAGFTCNPWLRRDNGFAQGFDVYEEIYRGETGPRDKGGEDATSAALDWVRGKTSTRPFFLFVNYLEAHLPYEPPRHVLERLKLLPEGSTGSLPSVPVEQMERFILDPAGLSREDLGRARGLYLAGVAYVDELVARLWTELVSIAPADDIVLVIVSDHGEHLGEHNLMGHEFTLFEPALRIPMLVRYPAAFSPGSSVQEPVSLLDVAPTLTGLLDLPPHPDSLGRDLRRVPESRTVIAEYARPRTLVEKYWGKRYPGIDLSIFDVPLASARQGSYKLIRTGLASERLFHLESDPDELNDLSESQPETLAALGQTLRSATKPIHGPDL